MYGCFVFKKKLFCILKNFKNKFKYKILLQFLTGESNHEPQVVSSLDVDKSLEV